ncbi:MAG: hypothetical protein N2235_06910 [Fischerella sp.]|nr:hypothetical protein [Fischerella sp.]
MESHVATFTGNIREKLATHPDRLRACHPQTYLEKFGSLFFLSKVERNLHFLPSVSV